MVRTSLVYVPNLAHSGLTRQTKGKIQGKGGAVLLRDGGAGAGSSYDSIDEYIATTGRNPLMRGGAVQSHLGKKLESLSLAVKPPKPSKIKNIKFNL